MLNRMLGFLHRMALVPVDYGLTWMVIARFGLFHADYCPFGASHFHKLIAGRRRLTAMMRHLDEIQVFYIVFLLIFFNQIFLGTECGISANQCFLSPDSDEHDKTSSVRTLGV